MAKLKKTVSRAPRVQAAPAATGKPVAAQPSTDYLFYAVPPLILLVIFCYCAMNSQPAKPVTTIVAAAPKQSVQKGQDRITERVIPPDVNNDLPAYAIPAGRVNVLAAGKAVATQSGYAKKFPAEHSVNDSLANDEKVSIAEAVQAQPAWWQAEVTGNGAAVDSVVIYGGGNGNPAGKLIGGFRVEIEDVNGDTKSRDFHDLGFALEGYELWKLDAPFTLKTIRVSSLNSRSPIILREVQAISAAQ